MEITTNKTLEALEWRYATKQYDKEAKIPQEQLETLLEAVRLAPSSYGLQAYKILVIENEEIRSKLLEAGYNQPQITDASHLIVFAAKTNVSNEYVDQYMLNIATARQIDLAQVQGFGDYIKGTIGNFTEDQFTAWNTKQAYIALGILLQTAAELRIDSSPMEGFVAAKFDEILNLKEHGLTTAVIAAIGYRSQEDTTQHNTKVRLDNSELYIHI